MQISTNTTGMEAGICVSTDKKGYDYCVVVVKGTFSSGSDGQLTLADEQESMVYADVHYGDPGSTSIRYECDFAPVKPYAEVIVVGRAVASRGEALTSLTVRLQVQDKSKDILVFGDRAWVNSGADVVASSTVPFSEMPLTFDRAFGGLDDTKGQGKIAVEQRNLVGVGFNPYRQRTTLNGLPLPNLEDPRKPIKHYRDELVPVGLGVIGRNWVQRAEFAGTYDQYWLDEVCPFLPADFDTRYFMSASQDQWFPYFKGGEVIRCIHMASEPIVSYVIPSFELPIGFQFVDRHESRSARLDTVVVEPHLRRAMLTWRASVPMGKKLTQLACVLIGDQPLEEQDVFVGYRSGKPHFSGLDAALKWLKDIRRK